MDGAGADFQLIHGLGMPGLALVRSLSSADVAANSLAANPNVAYYEMESSVTAQELPDDPRFDEQPYLTQIDAPAAWDVTTGDPGIVVAVVDSGVDYTHPDLANNIWTNPGEIPGDGIDNDRNGFVDDVHGYDFFADDGDPMDRHGHGTHVAGIIAAEGNNTVGTSGVAWRSSIMVLRFLDSHSRGFTSDAIRALNYATMMREQYGVDVRIVNNSWGSYGQLGGSRFHSFFGENEGVSYALREAIQANLDAGMLVVSAAGNGVGLNEGVDIDRQPFYPAAFDLPNMLTVAAVDAEDRLLASSNFGDRNVDIAAPGSSILSTDLGGGYRRRSGTSMAAPVVSGVAALAWSQSLEASAAEIRSAILRSAEAVEGLAGLVTTGGRVNAAGALSIDTVAPRAELLDRIVIQEEDDQPRRFTVRYTDASGILNNLDGSEIEIRRAGRSKTLLSISQVELVATPCATEDASCSIEVTYEVQPPGGTWDEGDNGAYQIKVQRGRIVDTTGNGAPEEYLGAIDVAVFATREPVTSEIHVNSYVDAIDAIPGDGICLSAAGSCTLRAAITEANARAGMDSIILPEGGFLLQLPGGDERAAATGDLDITEDLIIRGAGAYLTTIDAGTLDRVVHVLGNITVQLSGLALTRGTASVGGGLLNSGGTVTLTEVEISSNVATLDGGGIFSTGELILQRSVVAENTADRSGGGIYLRGVASVTNTTISGNIAINDTGGAIAYETDTTLDLESSTITDNRAGRDGGGIGVIAIDPSVLDMYDLHLERGGDGTSGIRIDDRLRGPSVSGAGDVNGDGIDDVIVAQDSFTTGDAYVVFGAASGLPVELELASLGGSDGFHINGGFDSVSGAGDLNNDGFDDFIIGDAGAGPDGKRAAGESYVVFGRASGFTAELDVSELNGTAGFHIAGLVELDHLDESVSGAGDVNNDGFDDLIVGADGADPNGKAYVMFGKAGGFEAEADLSELDGTTGFSISGRFPDTSSRFGYRVSNAGDLNGDGFDDIIVGDYRAGDCYVVFGKGAGFTADLDSSNLDGTNGFRITGGGYLGISVSRAGDINADGYDDLILGAFGAERSYVVFGRAGGFSPTMAVNELDGTDGFRIDGATSSHHFGRSVSGAGDFNADGFDDMIIAAESVELPDGTSSSESYLIFGQESGFPAILNVAMLDGVNGIRLRRAGFGFGKTVSGAGDINSDGFDDVIVSSNPGSYIIWGRATATPSTEVRLSNTIVAGNAARTVLSVDLSALDGLNGFRLDGKTAGDNLGVSVSGTGDVNDDGVDDLIIGAWGSDPEGKNGAGEAYVVFGQRSGFDPTFDLSLLDGVNGFRIPGVDAEDLLGSSVSGAGDFNADGIGDMIIGARNADQNGKSEAGASYVVFGQMGGHVSELDLALLDGTNGFRIDGDNAVDQSGWSVSDAGDINGDGVDDLIIGAPGADPGGKRFAGESYVLFGNTQDRAASLDPAALDGTNGFRILGDESGGQFGRSVSGGGDVNADGYDDVIIGSPRAPTGDDDPLFTADGYKIEGGETYIVYGRASGFPAELDVTRLSGTNHSRLDAENVEDWSGWRVTVAGDINADGIDDVIIGAPYTDPDGNEYAGTSYVVFGTLGRLASPVVDDGSPINPPFRLSTLDGSNGFRIDGVDYGDRVGTAVSGAGDINGDGIDDIIIPAPGRNSESGETYVVFGNAGGFPASVDVSTLDGFSGFRIGGAQPGDLSGVSVGGIGDVNGDGIDDLIIGAYHADPDGKEDAGAAYVVFGRRGGFPPILGTNPDISGTFLSGGNNFIGDRGSAIGLTHGVNGDQVGSSDFSLDPRLGPLTDNGGSTRSHDPLVGSPVIDSGKTALQVDQRGEPRPLDGDHRGAIAADIGAVESFSLGVLRGTSFRDDNANGWHDDGEPALVGWTVFLDGNGNRRLDDGELFTLTGSEGEFEFIDVRPGDVVLRPVLPPNWQTASDISESRLRFDKGSIIEGLLLANVPPAAVRGFVFHDFDADGTFEPDAPNSEIELADWRVFADLNQNRMWDEGEPDAVTDASGRYSLTLPSLQSYFIMQQLPFGWRSIEPVLGSHAITPGVGEIIEDIDFAARDELTLGGVNELADITGRVTNQAGEGLPDQRVFVDVNGDGRFDPNTERGTMTDANGEYRLQNLPFQPYSITVDVPDGLELAAPDGIVLQSELFNFPLPKVTAITTGDLNADGQVDLVLATESEELTVLLGDEDDGFAFSRTLTTGSLPQAVIVANLVGDEQVDIAAANFLSGGVWIWENNVGEFSTPPIKLDTPGLRGGGPRDLLAVDFDHDGDLDLAVALVQSDLVSVYWNTDTGFQRGSGLSTGLAPTSLAWNGDRIVAANAGGNTLSLLPPDGTGATMVLPVVGRGPIQVLAEHVVSDEFVDLIAVNRDSNSITIFVQQPDGSYDPQPIPLGGVPLSATATDLDGDQDLDLVIGLQGETNLVVLLNHEGRFSSASDFVDRSSGVANFDGELISRVLAADLNDDDHPDLISIVDVASTRASRLAALHNTTGPAPHRVVLSAAGASDVDFQLTPRAPRLTLDAIDPPAILRDSADPITISLRGFEPGTSGLTFEVTADRGELFRRLQVNHEASESTAALILYPKPGQEGDTVVTVTLTDAAGTTASQSFPVRIAKPPSNNVAFVESPSVLANIRGEVIGTLTGLDEPSNRYDVVDKRFVLQGQELSLKPDVYLSAGPTSVEVKVTDANGLTSRRRVPFTAAANSHPWQNMASPTDVNADGGIYPLDALIVINEINRRSPRALEDVRPAGAYLFDVNGDGHISPIDVLQVVNLLNQRVAQGEGPAPFGAEGIHDAIALHNSNLPRWTSETVEISNPTDSRTDHTDQLELVLAFPTQDRQPSASQAAARVKDWEALLDVLAADRGDAWQLDDYWSKMTGPLQ